MSETPRRIWCPRCQVYVTMTSRRVCWYCGERIEDPHTPTGDDMRIILCAGTHGRAVIIGDVESDPVPGEPVRLTGARMVLYWSVECGGLLGLAARGPQTTTRITAAVPVVVETTWQEWVQMTNEAARAVDAWPAC